MRTKVIFAALAVSLLSGCSSFQPNEDRRGVEFPLDYCVQKHFDNALVKVTDLTTEEPNPKTIQTLGFDKSWVCRTPPLEHKGLPAGTEQSKAQQEELAANNPAEIQLRTTLEAPFMRSPMQRPYLGIALSGGGTKASAVATGVLAGLSDLKLLDRADYISSVSGGGYASYFFYAQQLQPMLRKDFPAERRPVTTEQLYRDCIFLPNKDKVSEDVYKRISAIGGCGEGKLLPEGGQFDNRYQAFLKCQQDVFKPANCTTGSSRLEVGIQSEVFVGTLLAVVPAFISSSLFDWGNTVSPAARTYRDGIGIAYGSTLTKPELLKEAEGRRDYNRLPCTEHQKGFALDCTENIYNPDPVALTFDELRKGLLMAKNAGKPMPFWIINAAAPLRRNVFGWVTAVKTDVTNSDMFEMTAVSHGSGRYGYVPTSPKLYEMTVLDSVTASAAFMDANNLILPVTIRGALGLGMHLAALDWGQDIPNYNTGDNRRRFHRIMPIPFTWLDSLWARTRPEIAKDQQLVDRARSVYIRLMDGGNAENLGAFSLLKRQTKNIIISDAAQDTFGRFDDVCGLARRARAPNAAMAHYLYIPGLRDFEEHCEHNEKGDDKARSYDLHNWPFEDPVLIGCMRTEKQPKDSPNPCMDLKFTGEVRVNGELVNAIDTRLFIVKPAVNSKSFDAQAPVAEQFRRLEQCWIRGEKDGAPLMPAGTLNCDTAAYMAANWKPQKGRCQTFPQHGTATMTMNSNERLFAAYRELARQYVFQSVISKLDNPEVEELLNVTAQKQYEKNFRSSPGEPNCSN